MARHRAFSQALSTVEPISFELAGSYQEPNPDWPSPSTKETPHKIPKTKKVEWTETFNCLPVAPGGLIDDMTGTLVQDPVTGGRRYEPTSVIRFVRSVVVDEDLRRFEELIHDTKRVVSVTTLIDVALYLIEEYSSRPS
jgi:hypothetical protein